MKKLYIHSKGDDNHLYFIAASRTVSDTTYPVICPTAQE